MSTTVLVPLGNAMEEHDVPTDVTETVKLLSYIIVSPLVAVFGIAANIINMFVYYRHGVSESVNISFFTLAVTDISSLIPCLWYGIGINPLITSRVDLSFDPLQIVYVTGAFPRLMFSKISFWITMYITLERCFCIVLPLHVKNLFTPKKTLIAMTLIYISGLFSSFPVIYIGDLFLAWKYDQSSNRTVLGMDFSDSYENTALLTLLINTIIFFISFTFIVASTFILILGLRRKKKWRSNATNTRNIGLESLSKRDANLSKTIILLSGTLIVSYLPYTFNCILMSVLDGFTIYGKYKNLFTILGSFSWLFESQNSAANIFIYYNMSTKYKETFHMMFTCLRFHF